MPVILLQVDAVDNATEGVKKVASSLGTLGNVAESTASKSAKLDATLLRQDATLLKLGINQQRYTQNLITQGEALGKAANATAAYQDALSRQMAILSGLSAGTIDAASATTQLADANSHVAATYQTFGTATDSAARATQRLDSSLATLKSTEAQRITQQERYNALLKEQPASTPSTASGVLSRAGGALNLGSMGQMAGYMLTYGAYSAASQSVGRSATYSSLVGTTAAETAANPATGQRVANMLSDLDTKLAASGTQPYQRNILMGGQYSLASLGIGSGAAGGQAKAVYDISSIAAKMSGASGAADISTATDTLSSLIADFGQTNSKNVVDWTRKVADQLQVAVRVGKAEMPDIAAQVAIPAAKAAQLGISTGDVLNAIASESAGGVPTGQLGDELNSLLSSSETATKNYRQRAVAKSLGIDYNAGFWGKYGITGGSQQIEQAMATQGITGSNRVAVLDSLFANQAASKGYSMMLSGGLFGNAAQMANASSGTGAVNQAFGTSQMYAGMQLQDQEAKLATAFDQLTTATLPALTSAISLAANGLESLPGINKWLDDLANKVNLPGKGAALDKMIPGGTTGLLALMAMTPAGPALDALKALSMVAPARTSGGASPAGGASSVGAAAGRITVPWNFTGPLLPNEVRGPAPNPVSTAGWWPTSATASQTPQTGVTTAAAAANLTAAGQATLMSATMAGVGGGSRTPPAVTAALNRLKDTIAANAGQNAVESALGTYRAVVRSQPTAVMPGVTQSKDIFAAEKLASAYEAGPLTNAAQLMVDAKQGMLTAAEQQGQTPGQLKTIFDSYIEAQRQLILVSTKPNTAQQAQQLGALAQQKATGDYGYGTDIINRTIKDMSNKVSMDKLGTDSAATSRDMAALLAYETANASRLGYDKSDLALMAAQNKAALGGLNPKSNTSPFFDTNAGLAAFGASPGSTAVRLGGAEESPVVQENRLLRNEISKDNAEIIRLLAQLVAAGIKPNVASAGRVTR
jgi:hypothetical protein